ncbi:MAG: prepilin peptidase [Eubacterium sp.]|nr:prepilin peptidase [Eubacterium sp.]
MENFLIIICLILLSVYDVKERRIPNSLVASIYLLGLIGLCSGRVSNSEYFVGLVVLPLIILALIKITKYKIGMGDVKLISAIGSCIGFWNQVLAVFAGLLICIIYLFGRFIRNK